MPLDYICACLPLVQHDIARFNTPLDTLLIISGMIFSAYHLTGAETQF